MNDSDGPSNVLFVVMDTVRKSHLSVYGYDRPTTPALEDFAEEATVFEEAVAPAPWTLPVHASMFTGLYPSQHDATQENPYLEGPTTLAESLSAADYATACYSSNAWITPYTNLTDGFDDQDNFFQVMPGEFLSGPLSRAWKAMNDNPALRGLADRLVKLGNTAHEYIESGGGGDSKTPAIVDRVQSFVEDSEAAGDDWFTFVNLMDAHLPYHPPEEYAQRFAPGVDSTEVCQNSKEFNCGARDIDDDEWADIRGLYDAEIRYIDDHLGRLFDWLEETDRWEDTLVVVCADHGELHGEHDLYGHEFCIYDPLVNVPLLVKHPDLDPGRDEETQVELQDLYHTVLDHADASVAQGGEPFDPARSLLDADYRDFASVEPGAGGGADARSRFDAHDAGDLDEVAFVDYHQPVVELRQLESKASAAGIELDENSRFYSRMRSARRPDGKYVRNEYIRDEAYRLDSDPDELENVIAVDAGADGDGSAGDVEGDDGAHGIEGDGDAGDIEGDEGAGDVGGDEDPDGDDPVIAEVERALVTFEDAVGGDWADLDDEDVLDDMGDDAKDRLRDLGYLE